MNAGIASVVIYLSVASAAVGGAGGTVSAAAPEAFSGAAAPDHFHDDENAESRDNGEDDVIGSFHRITLPML